VSAVNVSSIKNPVNATLEDVRVWLSAMGDKGIIGGEASRQRISALNQLESILGDEEPREAQWMLDSLKSVAQRWAIKNQGNPNTAATYESRSRRALTDYMAYLANPTGFTPRAERAKPERSAPARRSEPQESSVGAKPAEAAPAVAQPPVEPQRKLHECPLGKDKEPFRYERPAEGLMMSDVLRIAMHLAAGAHDFEPATQVVVLNHYPKLPDSAQ